MELRFLFCSIQFVICLEIFCSDLISSNSDRIVYQDILKPYINGHGPKNQSHRHTRSIQPSQYGNYTHEVYPSLQKYDVQYPIVESLYFVEEIGEYWEMKKIMGHYFLVNNPLHTFSVLEPHGDGGCQNKRRANAKITGHVQNCLVSTNAGFFNTHDNSCLGDIVSNGRVIQFDGIQNAHFGILKDGSIFTGYIPDNPSTVENFQQLISGVVWLVRDGKNYVDISKNTESSDTQTTGSLKTFIEVTSARLAVGHDRLGRVVIVAIDGKTNERGVNLYEFADLLIKFGIVNAINLDGGGSVTTVINGTLANYPGDVCESKLNGMNYNCPRNVSTVLCIHDPACGPNICNGNGVCKFGKCHCHENWSGDKCDQIQCDRLNCSGHGLCTSGGCVCQNGWRGRDCDLKCVLGMYGLNCKSKCPCVHSTYCDHVDGRCVCQPGYTGRICDRECEYGRYGDHCRSICQCDFTCPCHHITGNCSTKLELKEAHYSKFSSQCLDQIFGLKYENIIARQDEQFRLSLILLLTFASIAGVSLICNFVMFFHKEKKKKTVSSVKNNMKNNMNVKNDMELLELSNSDYPTAEARHKTTSNADEEYLKEFL